MHHYHHIHPQTFNISTTFIISEEEVKRIVWTRTHFFTVNVSLLSFNLILNLVWRVLINNLSDVWTENWPTKFVGISVSIILLCTDKLCCEMLNGHIHFDVLSTNRLGFNFLLSISSLTGDSYYNFNHISSTCSTRNNSFPLLQ